MSQHPNARLTPRGRETLVSRIESGTGVSDAARQMGVSRQTANKWLDLFQDFGHANERDHAASGSASGFGAARSKNASIFPAGVW